MALLSVMTPIYNGAAFVRRCYHTLRLQSFQDWEWVVVNDGSTDNTVELIREIQQRDPRVRLIDYAKNRGRGFARTKAIAAAKGDWVVVWDVDDLYLPQRLERIDRARSLGFDFYVSRTITADPQLNFLSLNDFSEPFAPLPFRVGYHSAMAVKTEVAREVGYLPGLRTVGQMGEDIPMVYEVAATRRGYFDDKPMAVYVVGHEVFLEKSIDVNTVRSTYWRHMRDRGQLPMPAENFGHLEARDQRKLFLLKLLRICPAAYPVMMRVRKFGLAHNTGRPLTWEENAFLAGIKERFSQPTQPVEIPVPTMQPELAYAN